MTAEVLVRAWSYTGLSFVSSVICVKTETLGRVCQNTFAFRRVGLVHYALNLHFKWHKFDSIRMLEDEE